MIKRSLYITIAIVAAGLYLHDPLQTSALEKQQRTSPPQEVHAQSLNVEARTSTVSNTPNIDSSDSPATAETKSVSRQSAPAKSPSVLDETVEQWKASLSKEIGFESWQYAVWNSYPLGPGTHGWAILLYKDGKEIGYMIVHSAPGGGLKLTEYGTGASPLFSMYTLYRSLVQQELIPSSINYAQFVNTKIIVKQRWYYNPLQAIWKVTMDASDYFLDAKTGELLPIEDLPSSDTAASSEADENPLTGRMEQWLVPSFDPYERLSWVQGDPVPIQQIDEIGEFKNELQRHSKLTYVSEPYEDKVTIPLAVLGYQQWGGGRPYLVLDQDGPRYVPFATAVHLGRFYP